MHTPLTVIQCARIVSRAVLSLVLTAVKEFGEMMQRAIQFSHYANIATNMATLLVRAAEDSFTMKMPITRTAMIIHTAESALKS